MDQSYDTRASSVAAIPRNLRQACLSYVEVLAQSVADIAPSTVPAAVLGLIYVGCGQQILLSIIVGYMVFGLGRPAVQLYAALQARVGAIDAVDVKFASLRERPS